MFKDKTGKDLSLSEAFQKIFDRILNVLLDFELMVLRCVGNIPSHLIRRYFYKMVGIRIGQGSTIHMWCNFFYPRGITVGEDTIIGDHAFLDGRDSLIIGDHVDIASYVLIYNSQHDISDPFFRAVAKPVIIEDYVFIGPRATILPGVRIGKGAVVAAGAVVTKDIPPFEIMAGIPAVSIGERQLKNPQYRLGRARLFQ